MRTRPGWRATGITWRDDRHPFVIGQGTSQLSPLQDCNAAIKRQPGPENTPGLTGNGNTAQYCRNEQTPDASAILQRGGHVTIKHAGTRPSGSSCQIYRSGDLGSLELLERLTGAERCIAHSSRHSKACRLVHRPDMAVLALLSGALASICLYEGRHDRDFGRPACVQGTELNRPVQRNVLRFVGVRVPSDSPGALLELIWLLRIRNGGWR